MLHSSPGSRRRLGLLSAVSLCAVATALVYVAQVAPPADDAFPPELVRWVPHAGNPLFAGTGQDTWDRQIRERGYILREGNTWRLWYTGYNPARNDSKFLGYATSADGIQWQRHPENPIVAGSWVEDMCVVRHENVYYMFAEGRDDIAHLLTSADGLHWQEHGSLDIRAASGQPISAGPYGTPTVWIEGGTWYLFYERSDRGVWLATSRDHHVWRNVQDEPVLARGPDAYDRQAVALNQVIRYRGRYYGVYHANEDAQWKGPWTTCLAASDDLIHWRKYSQNPVIRSNDSSGVLVDDGRRLRLYTMHPAVKLWLPEHAAGVRD
jgi:hypothetical protein